MGYKWPNGLPNGRMGYKWPNGLPNGRMGNNAFLTFYFELR